MIRSIRNFFYKTVLAFSIAFGRVTPTVERIPLEDGRRDFVAKAERFATAKQDIERTRMRIAEAILIEDEPDEVPFEEFVRAELNKYQFGRAPLEFDESDTIYDNNFDSAIAGSRSPFKENWENAKSSDEFYQHSEQSPAAKTNGKNLDELGYLIQQWAVNPDKYAAFLEASRAAITDDELAPPA